MSTSYGFSTYRPVRPAGGGDKSSSPPRSQEKRRITPVACLSCQKKRCKCDGKRPRCAACTTAGNTSDCVYETRGNQSRSEALKERNQELKDENTRLKQMLLTTDGAGTTSKIQAEVMTPSSVVGPEPPYDLSLGSYEGSTAGTRTPSSVLSGQEVSNQMPQRRSGIGASNASLIPSNLASGLILGEENQPKQPLPVESEASLQNKVARLEAEVESLKAAVSQHFSIQNQAAPQTGTRGKQVTLQPQGLGTINPNQITMEATESLNRSVGGLPYSVPPLPFSMYSAMPSVLPDLATFNNPVSAIAPPQATTPFSTLKRPRSPSNVIQRYIHKRRKYGSMVTFFGNLPLSSAILANHQPLQIQETQIRSLELPTYLVQILNSEDHGLERNDNVLSPEFASSTFYSFREYGRQLIANHANVEDVLGPNEIDVQQFFKTEQYVLDNHTTSTFAPWFLQSYPSMSLPSKVACALIIQLLLRWQISPTVEHFDALPEWFKATGCQMFIPHISAFDYIPWPEIRDLLIVEGKLPEKRVLVMIVSNFIIDWPDSTEDIFTWDYASGTATGVSPRFVEHVHDIQNWAINAKVLRHYPFLEGKARFVHIDGELEQVPTNEERKRREGRHGHGHGHGQGHGREERPEG